MSSNECEVEPFTGTASTVINRPAADVFSAVTDVSRMGEWSPECTGGEWLDGASPGVGASFSGHNEARFGPLTVKRWTTTSQVSEYIESEVFEFVAEGHTTWRYDFEPLDSDRTRVTESYVYPPMGGVQGFVYETLARRPAGMRKGMEQTLGRLKAVLEA